MSDQDFRRWFERNARRSDITAQEFARVLHRVVGRLGLTPGDLVKKAKKNRRAVEDLLDDLIGELEKEGKAPDYIGNHLKAAKSWLTFNDIRLQRRFYVRNQGTAPTLDHEQVPTQDELRATLNAATPRGRVIISFMAFSGLRPGTLGNFHGTDGLKVRDLPELHVAKGKVTIDNIPTLVVIRPVLSKARHRYPTFLPNEGCRYFCDYLQQRMAGGEHLGLDSPVVAVAPRARDNELRQGREADHISTKNITDDVRDAFRAVGLKVRPYVWRSFFDTNLLIAESRGKVPQHYRITWMGHKAGLGAEGRYTTHRNAWPETLIEDMRAKFRDAEAFLVTTQSSPIDLERIERLEAAQAEYEARLEHLLEQFGSPELREKLRQLVVEPGSLRSKVDTYGGLARHLMPVPDLQDLIYEMTEQSVKRVLADTTRKVPDRRPVDGPTG